MHKSPLAKKLPSQVHHRFDELVADSRRFLNCLSEGHIVMA
jgi:hypothetical protein